MTIALILWCTAVAGLTIGWLAWERAERRHAARHAAAKVGWTVVEAPPYDWARDVEAWEREMSDERGE